MTIRKYYKLGLHYNQITDRFEYESGQEVIEYHYYVERSGKSFHRIQLIIKDIGNKPKFGSSWLVVDKYKLKKKLKIY